MNSSSSSSSAKDSKGYSASSASDTTYSPSTTSSFTPLSKDQLQLLQQPQANVTLFANPLPTTSTPPNYTSMPVTSSAGPATLQFHDFQSNPTASSSSYRPPSPLNLEREIRSFTAGDTLDEPVSATLIRDLSAIWQKLKR
ncbi:hypothetical protein HMI54_010544, partial [Coelomomyces lativittatus]